MRAKPTFGDPCNGCGLCCQLGPCGPARVLLGAPPPGQSCPALVAEDDGFRCGLADRLELDDTARQAVVVAIGAGIGCDMRNSVMDNLVAPGRRPEMQRLARKANRDAPTAVRRRLARWGLAPP